MAHGEPRSRRPDVLDLVTGAVRTPDEFDEEFRRASPDAVRGDSADLCVGYGEYRLVSVNYFLEADQQQHSHVFAFRDDGLAGRLECVGDRVTVFKDGLKSFETVRPQSGGGAFQFPQDVKPVSRAEPGGKACGPTEFDAVWKTSRYADLFNETLRSIYGWMRDSVAVLLSERFDSNPPRFVRALADASLKEAERVALLLADTGDYAALDAYRRKVEALAKDSPSGKEMDVLDRLLETEHLVRLGRQVIEGFYAGDCGFLQRNTRNTAVDSEGITYFYSGERIYDAFPDDGRSPEASKVLDMSSRGRDEVLIIYEMVGGPSEGTGQIRIHLVRRDGKWKVEMIGMDI